MKDEEDESIDNDKEENLIDQELLIEDNEDNDLEEEQQPAPSLKDAKALEMTERMMRIYPIFLAVLSAFFNSCLSVLVKFLSNSGNHTLQILLFRASFTGLIAVTLLWFQEKKSPWDMDKKFYAPLMARSTIGFFNVFCLFFSIKYLPLSEAVVISYVCPVFVGIFALIFLKERWYKLDAFGVVLCFTGVVFIARPPFLFRNQQEDKDFNYWLGIIAALGNAVLNAIVICLLRFMGKGIHALQNICWISAVTVIFSGIGLIYLDTFHVPSAIEWIQYLAVGIVSFIGHWTGTRALQLENAAIIATVGYLQVAFSVLNDFVFYSLLPSYWSAIGVFLICSWAFISSMRQWYKGDELIWITRMRLKIMGRSTSHQMIPLEDQDNIKN